MTAKKMIIATVIGALVLFLFDGALQAIPNFGVRAVERLETNQLTTGEFSELANSMAYIATETTVSFVAVKEVNYYNLSRFFAIEFFSAFAIAMVFALLFAKIPFADFRERLWLTFGFSLIAGFAIHLPYFNWWGFSLAYTGGVVIKTIMGWMLVALIQNRLIYKIK